MIAHIMIEAQDEYPNKMDIEISDLPTDFLEKIWCMCLEGGRFARNSEDIK